VNPLYWSSSMATFAGVGEVAATNPGTGQGRYSGALEWLKTNRGRIGFAAFTFDPDDPFSVVLVPEEVDRSWEPTGGSIPEGRITSEGADDWSTGFEIASAALAAGDVEKVVLARQVTLGFDSDVGVEAVLARLISYNLSTHVFSVDGLVGASPELLVRVFDGKVTSLVLAGTAPTVEGLKTSLIAEEHHHASVSVEAALAPLTSELTWERSPIIFGKISHLGTRFEADARPGIGVLDLVAALHPTSAVCGSPRNAALELIRRAEPRSRGRYGGPVGWFDSRGNGEFALALRCGQVLGDEVTLYAGGGLVKGSKRDLEWEETNLKLGPMLQALNLRT
jgi:menaquinone-specific isochorismate synthase